MKNKNNLRGVSDEIIEEINGRDARNASSDEADNQIRIACEGVYTLLCRIGENDDESIVKNHPTLLGVHALLSTLEFYGDRVARAVEKIAESVDLMAVRPDSKALLVPRAEESELIVATLKADWLKHHPNHSENEYIVAMHRFEILAGL